MKILFRFNDWESMNNIEIIQTIDYILKELDYKYKDNFRLYIWEDNHNHFPKKVFDSLYDKKCFDFRTESEDIYYEWEYKCTETNEWIYNGNLLKKCVSKINYIL